ncbi:MAG TPA: MDR family MFS transporter [Candidatus Limnocylindrales bacterium]|jgi:EmrB/QacA subfamily drug resistance transporter
MESFPSDADRGVTPSLSEDPALGLDRRAKLEILGAILLALFLGALDQTVVGTALPRIVTDLGGNDLYTWVVTIYLLTSTITVPFYGKLSDLYGRKPLLIIGVSLFLLGSALSGLSQNMTQLIIFRGIQGVGAGALFPIALAVIGDLFTPAERGKYQGLFGAVFGISFLVGPWLGGFITDNISWHWVFYVNLPIGIVSLFVIWRLLPNIRRTDASRNLDYAGALVFTVAISALLVGLTNKIDQATFTVHDWTEPQVGGLIGLGLILGVVFLFIESRAKEPIVPLDLWRNRTYVSSMLSTFLVSFGFFGAVIFLPRWFQAVRGESATASGYLMFPLLLGLIGSSIVSGQIVSRTGRYRTLVLVAIACMAVGILLMTQLSADTPLPQLFVWMFITGVGIGPTLAVFTIIVQNAVPFQKLGVATSNLTFFRQIGGSVGLAIAGTYFAESLRTQFPQQVSPVFSQIAASAPEPVRPLIAQFQAAMNAGGATVDLNRLTGVGQSFGQAITDAAAAMAGTAGDAARALFTPFIPALDHAFFEAFSRAIGSTFWIAFGATVLALLAALVMRELPLRSAHGPRPAGQPGEARDAALRRAPAAD